MGLTGLMVIRGEAAAGLMAGTAREAVTSNNRCGWFIPVALKNLFAII